MALEAVEQVKDKLSGLRVRTLINASAASLSMASVPDASNPGAYYDRWVLLKYRGWFGIRRTKILYFEQSASDELRQRQAYEYARRVVAAVNSSQ